MSWSDAPIEAPEPQGRRERKKERTRREIYGAAMELFAHRGFDGVTVEHICEAADVARGTFFAHFPTKAALLFEFGRAMTAEFAAAGHDPDASATDDLRALCVALSEAWLERAEVMTAMLREFLVSPESLAAAETEQPFLPELIEEIVARGQARGEFRPGIKPRLASAVFLSTSLAILSGQVFDPGESDPDVVREQFLSVILRGLVADETGAGSPERPPRTTTDRRSR